MKALAIYIYSPGAMCGGGEPEAIITDLSRKNDIQAMILMYNAGLGEYGNRYEMREIDILVDQIPEELVTPRCKCGEKTMKNESDSNYGMGDAFYVNHSHNCPIHGLENESDEEKRARDPIKYDCMKLIKEGKRIEAIKHYREARSWSRFAVPVGLSDAMKQIDEWSKNV
jgi:hypothetical protein